MDNVDRCQRAFDNVAEARDLLKAAGAGRASAIVSSAIPAVEAALRNARAARKSDPSAQGKDDG